MDAVMTPLHKNLLLGWFYNDSCQYINGLQVRINIKKRIVLAQGLFHAKGTRHTPLCSTGYDGFGTFVRLNRLFGGLTFGDALGSQLPILLKEVCAFKSIPTGLAFRVALLILDDGSHSDLLCQALACVW